MGGTRALVTIKDGATYINDAASANSFLAALVPTLACSSAPSTVDEDGDVELDLIRTFRKKIKVIASEVGDQICLTSATGKPCETGGDAYRAARCEAPRLADGVRRSARASGRAKHDMSDVIHRAPLTFEHIKHVEDKIDQLLVSMQSLVDKMVERQLPEDIATEDMAPDVSPQALTFPAVVTNVVGDGALGPARLTAGGVVNVGADIRVPDLLPTSSREISSVVDDKVFVDDVVAFLGPQLRDAGFAGAKIYTTRSRLEIIIRASETTKVLGEKGARIRSLTGQMLSRYKCAHIELFAERA